MLRAALMYVSGWQKKARVRVKGGGYASEINGRFEKFR